MLTACIIAVTSTCPAGCTLAGLQCLRPHRAARQGSKKGSRQPKTLEELEEQQQQQPDAPAQPEPKQVAADPGNNTMFAGLPPRLGNWEFQQRRAKQRAFVGIAQRLTMNLSRDGVVVGWGSSAAARGGIPRCGATASKPFLHGLCSYAQLKMVSEFNISQVCSHCGAQLEAVSGIEAHALRKCPSCKVIRNRDVNTARNIQEKLGCKLRGDPFPQQFVRQGPAQQAGPAAAADQQAASDGEDSDASSAGDSELMYGADGDAGSGADEGVL